MKIQAQLFSDSVARKIFLLVSLSVLVPFVTVYGILSLNQWESLTENDRGELEALSGSYATTLFETLTLASGSITHIAEEHVAGYEADHGIAGDLTWTVVDRAELLPPTDSGWGEAEDIHFSEDKSIIRLWSIGDQQTLSMVRPMRSNPSLLLFASLDKGWFDRRSIVLPDYVDVCVFVSGPVPYYCSDAHLLQTDWSSNAIATHAYIREAPHLPDHDSAYAMELFLAPQFLTRGWKIALFRKQGTQAGTTPLGMLSYPVLILSVLVSIYLVSVLIRRCLGPLRALQAGTQRVADGDFDYSISVSGNDEFARLGRSFNIMSSHVGKQIERLKLFAEIDREIVDTSDLEVTLREVLRRALALLDSYDAVGVVTDDLGSDTQRRFFWIRENDAIVRSTTLDSASLTGGDVSERSLANALQQESWRQDRTLVVPMSSSTGHTCLVLHARPQEVISELRDQELLKDVKERVSIALSTRIKEQKLHDLAYYDSLTGLPSRELVTRLIEQELSRAQRRAGLGAVLFVDLDRFKNVNDTYGHEVGDRLLKLVAERFRLLLRTSDSVSRFAGDEFVFLLTDLHSRQDAENVASKIIASMAESFVIDHIQLFIGVSVGIAMLNESSIDADTVLGQADTAMYRSKESGRSRLTFFEPHMHEQQRERTALERDLRLAISRGELTVHYQPKIDLRNGSVEGVEALLRWQHADGLVPPDRFIPIAEDIGLIDEIGYWVLRKASQQIVRLNDELGLQLKLAVNLSPKQFERGTVDELLEAVLSSTGLEPGLLDLEITEGVVVTGFDRARATLARVRSKGVTISIDDFGTGYSSLSYLQRLPIDTVKIDRAFVEEIDDGNNGGAIAYSIIAMAHNLGLNVVAEGIEDMTQLRNLRQKGCDLAQGYLFSRPLDYAGLQRFLLTEAAGIVDLLPPIEHEPVVKLVEPVVEL